MPLLSRYSGGLIALILVVILGVTLFTAWENIDTEQADAAEAVAMTEGDADTTTAEEAAPAEAASDEPAAAEEATVEEPAAEEAAAEEDASESAAADGPSPEVVTSLSKATCISCHTISDVPGAVGMVGPDLSNIGVDGATRVDGMDAEAYIHESIIDPDAFIAPSARPAHVRPAS